jgi:four helix bundle protein
MKNFRTYDLAKKFYENCQQLTLKPPVRDQFERASLSIVCNLAEGSGKPTPADRKKFYASALGSLRETQALLEILKQTQLACEADILGAHIYKLIKNPGQY